MCRSFGALRNDRDEYYQHFAPSGAKTGHSFLNLARMGLAPALSHTLRKTVLPKNPIVSRYRGVKAGPNNKIGCLLRQPLLLIILFSRLLVPSPF